ncbi:glucosyltransferase domain-containing protein, partial [Leclercia adecarboxylata]
MDIKNLTITQEDKPLIYTIIVSLTIVYGYSLANYSMSIDNEFTEFFAQKLSIGRWGGAFLKETILPNPYAPFFTNLIFCIFLGFSAFTTSKLLSFKRNKAILFSVLCISYPAIFYQADFIMQSDAVSIGMFVGVISAYLVICSLEKIDSTPRKIGIYILSALFYCFSISVYQSIFNTALGIIAIFYAHNYYEGRKTLTICKLLAYICWIISALSLYVICTKALQAIYHIEGASYLINQIGWLHNSLTVNITTILAALYKLTTGSSYYGAAIFRLASVCFVLHVVMCFWKRRGAVSIIMALLAYLSPFVLVIALASDAPPRTFTFQPFIHAFFICTIVFSYFKESTANYVTYILCIIGVWFGSSTYSKLMFSDHMIWQSDKITAAEIISTIRNKIPQYSEGETPIYFYGALNKNNIWKPGNSDIFGSSFFAWDGGNSERIIAFYRSNLIADIKPVTYAQAMSINDKIKEVKPWPSREAIFMENGIVVVKLSNNEGFTG